MNLCLDLSPVVHQKAGLASYARELAIKLVEMETGISWSVFHYDRHPPASLPSPLNILPRRVVPWGAYRWRSTAALCHFLGLNMDSLFRGVDLFHATEHLLPRFSRIKTVFTLHDLIFLFHPETHKPMNRWFLTLMMPRFLRAADAVITVSECTKKDAMRFYNIPEEKITVIYEGVSPRFHPVSSEIVGAVRLKYGLPERFILYVGTIEPRKNLIALLEALHYLLTTYHLQLVIVGKKGWLYEGFFRRLRELGLEERVHFTGYVPDEDLPALYSAADLFVFPSLYEGFGLPVLEAMACGVPVICSNTSSLPEVAGDAALLVDPTDVQALAKAIERALTDETLRAMLRAKGLERARMFTWEKTAQKTLEVYRRVLGNCRTITPSGNYDNSAGGNLASGFERGGLISCFRELCFPRSGQFQVILILDRYFASGEAL
ncbi:MAG: glycosyltransferase family 1 protein [Anaerolineae bacterium]|nr:glycosyltransferase family 4 protein [Anaerolineae bacterium]MDW8102180.1 glycosyltransferase family 1 protein [Anaerolineae bacterium]